METQGREIRTVSTPRSSSKANNVTTHGQNMIKVGEVGQIRHTYYLNIIDEYYNPDDVGPTVYYAMKDGDAQVKASLSLLNVATLSRGWNIVPTAEGQEEMVKFIDTNLKYLMDDFDGSLEEMLSCIWAGFSVTEKVFAFDKDMMKYYLKKLKTLDPRHVTFKMDKYGNLMKKGICQWISEKIELPTDKFIVWTHNREFGNVYGKSDLRACHKDWFIKDVLIKLRNIYLEQHGAPTYVGKVQSESEIDGMLDMLDRLNVAANAAIKEGREISVLESSRSGDPFSEAIGYHDKMISRVLLIPSLMLGASDRGSYALSKSHLDIFLMRIAYFQRKIVNIMEKHVIKPLIDINFGKQDQYPMFSFKPMTESDRSKLADVFFKLTQSGHVNPGEDWVREEFGYPKWKPEESPTGPYFYKGSGLNDSEEGEEIDEDAGDE